jgi:hypothetical protein
MVSGMIAPIVTIYTTYPDTLIRVLVRTANPMIG